MDLKAVLEKMEGLDEFCKDCHPSGELGLTILWILQGQCRLMLGYGHAFTPQDFGAPASAGDDREPAVVYDNSQGLPSIKMKKETILAKTMKPGPHMHDP